LRIIALELQGPRRTRVAADNCDGAVVRDVLQYFGRGFLGSDEDRDYAPIRETAQPWARATAGTLSAPRAATVRETAP